jgi:hypothetical protein
MGWYNRLAIEMGKQGDMFGQLLVWSTIEGGEREMKDAGREGGRGSREGERERARVERQNE